MIRRLVFMIIIGVSVLAASLAGSAVLTVMAQPLGWREWTDTTTFAPGYTDETFRGIGLGMNKREVIRLLGPPLSESVGHLGSYWNYGFSDSDMLVHDEDGGIIADSGRGINLEELCQGHTSVSFDERGHVIGYSGNFLKLDDSALGMSAEEVAARYGKPWAIHNRMSASYLIYSRSDTHDSYRVRAIGLDGAGKVVEIKRYYYQD